MSSAPGLAELTPEEYRVVRALREIPPSPLRERLSALLGELADFVRRPSCPELQADGTPCTAVEPACEECLQLTELLDQLRAGLRRA